MLLEEKMLMEKEVMYVAPLVEILEVEVEKGFAVSDPEMEGITSGGETW